METGRYLIYLRKSREDRDAEMKGEGETLARHRRELLDLADRTGILVKEEDIFEEIVSGDSIAARPVMQKLLTAVEQGNVTGVLCIDIDRLGRGNMIDQGIIQQTFLYSNTLIITPSKTYDMSNEIDNTTVEFKSLMARQELNMIKKRLIHGREASVKEGKWVGSEPPYGYNKVKLSKEKGYTLQVNQEEAKVVKLIFDLFLKGFGANRIAGKLGELGIKTNKGNAWSAPSVIHLLKNDVYVGKVHYGRKKKIKVMENGILVEKRKVGSDTVCVDGIHEPIINMETWEKVCDKFTYSRAHSAPIDRTLKNPLATILKCEKCGYTMSCQPRNDRTQSNKKRYVLFCKTKNCSCHASYLDLVEKQFINSLNGWLEQYKTQTLEPQNQNNTDIQKSALQNIISELEKLERQLDRTCELLEQGLYSKELFIARSSKLYNQINTLKKQKEKLEASISRDSSIENYKKELFPKTENLLESYWSLDSEAKNTALKEIIERATYVKEKYGKGNEDAFTLHIYPRLPKKQNPCNLLLRKR